MRVNAGDLLLRLDCDAGAGQPSGGQQATRRSAGEERAAGRRARRSAPAGDPAGNVVAAGRQQCQDAAGFGGVAVPGAGDGAREPEGAAQEQGIAAWRGDRGPRGAGRIQGQATGADHGRTHGRAGALRQASRADRAAHGPAARGRQNRRRTRPVDLHHRRDQDQDRRGEAADGPARPGCTDRSRQGSRRGAGQGSRTQRTKRRRARRPRAHRDARADVGRDPSAERAHHRRRDSRRRRRHGGGAGFRRSADRGASCSRTTSTRCGRASRPLSASRPSTSG